MSSSYNAITGTDTANTLVASGLADDIKALAGHDVVTGVADNDKVSLGAGDDTMSVSAQFGVYDNISVIGGSGKDSLHFNWAPKDSTISGGSNHDKIYLRDYSGNKVYGDSGDDSLLLFQGLFKSSVYGGNLSDATANDGNDSISLGLGAEKALIHGNGGSDTLYFTNVNETSIYGGQGDDYFKGENLSRTVASSYLTGNLGNDTIILSNYKCENTTIFGGGGYLFDTSNDGSDSLFIENSQPYGVSSALIHGNGGNDTIFVSSWTNSATSTDQGIYNSSIYGGQGDDYIDTYINRKFRTTYTSALLTGNLGNDTLDIGGRVRQTSIYGGSGDNLINLFEGFDAAKGDSNNTYYFGQQTGNDTLSFGPNSTSGGLELTIAVDETLGNPLGFTFDSNSKLVNLGSGKTIFVDGYTGTRVNDISSLGLTFTTVSSSTITALG